MKERKHDLDVLVIGAGSAGFAAAVSAAQAGAKVAIVERGKLGGDCPNFACVPTKTFLHAASRGLTWKQAQEHALTVANILTGSRLSGMLAGLDVTHIKGSAECVDAHTVKVGAREWSATSIVIAGGAKTAVPEIPGLEKSGFLTYKDLVSLKKIPRSAVVIGGGSVGTELAEILYGFGAEVTVIEAAHQLLPKEEPEIASVVEESFRSRGIHVYVGGHVTGVTKSKKPANGKKILSIHQGRMEFEIMADEIFVATGRKSIAEDLHIERAGIALDEYGALHTDNQYRAASAKTGFIPNIFAAGDVKSGPHFTHLAAYDGNIAGTNAAAHALGTKKFVSRKYEVIPQTIFTTPEVASVGLSEVQAEELAKSTEMSGVKVGRAFFAGFGKALTHGSGEGLVKVVTEKKSGVILGASIVGECATELIHELALAVHLKATYRDVSEMMHAYPTGAEVIKAACADVDND